MKSVKKIYDSPIVNLIHIDKIITMNMASEPGVVPGMLDQIDGWPESGWTQKLFKIIFR